MFARNVSVNLKPGTLAEFTQAMENEILPWLRKQKGFLGVMTLAVPGGREVLAISFWDQKENAQAYHSTGYRQVLKILGKLLEGTPHVRTFEVVTWTLEKLAPAKPPETERLFERTCLQSKSSANMERRAKSA
jgi:heme-degrading monooxygenase HmoA